MIEFTSAIALIFMTFIGRFSNIFNFKELFDVSYETLLLFTVFGRCFMSISTMQTIAEKKRILFESFLFMISTICLSILYLYHTRYFLNNDVPKIVISSLCFFIFLIVKIYVLKHNTYGSKYLMWQIIDIFLLAICSSLSFTISESNLTFKNGMLAIITMLILGIVNEHVLKKLNYWTALKDFKSEIKLLILNKKIAKITYPPDKNLDKDPIYSKCVIILQDSTIRVLDAHYLSKIVLKYLLRDGYSFKEAHQLSSKFLMVLNNNLMRRKWDSSIIPSRILNFIYNKRR